MAKTRREHYEERLAALKKERASWDAENREVAAQMAPYRVSDKSGARNKGEKLDADIINSTPVLALGILAAGMMAGITSPARKWFGLTHGDPVLRRLPRVRQYFEDCTKAIANALHRSNWYAALSPTYLDLGSIGTSSMFAEHDGRGGVHFTPMVWGEYYADINPQGDVDVLFQERTRTVRQIVREFGKDACSRKVREHWDRGEYNQPYVVIHGIFPNDEREPGKIGPKGMPFSSVWWEATNPDKNQFLREGGYHEFAALVPRWSALPSDAYGRGPGHVIKGDCKALQHHELRKAEMIDKIVAPPTITSGGVSELDMRPGAITEVAMGQQVEVRPLVVIPPGAIGEVRAEIDADESRINKAMYVNLWQAAISDENNERPTATEVEARRQEVMLMLGPLLESLDSSLLEPCIRRVFGILDRADMLPLPPPELEGAEIKVEFISIMHQAQQATGAAGLRGLLLETAQTAAISPDVVDKINTDAVVDHFAEMLGVPNDVVRTDEEVKALREARAKRQQIAEEGQAALDATQGAKNLGGVDASKLTDVLGALGPVAGAQAEFGPV